MDNPSQPGNLFIVATPIGNLSDISQRAVTTLSEVDIIACEDTRHTRKLLSHLQITTSTTSYYREKEQEKAAQLLKKLQDGFNIALVSDAGTPGLSDPGSVLVRLARDADIQVIPIPGPSALTAALSAAGLEESSFYFAGFSPAQKGPRKKMLSSLAQLPCTLIFYESPHRITSFLKDCLSCLGDRDALLFRELTKIHEECLAGPLSSILSRLASKVKGELVVIIRAPQVNLSEKPEDIEQLICWYRDQGTYSLKDTVRHISTDLDLSRSQVYQQALVLWHNP